MTKKLSTGLPVDAGVSSVLLAAICASMTPYEFASGIAQQVAAGDTDDLMICQQIRTDVAAMIPTLEEVDAYQVDPTTLAWLTHTVRHLDHVLEAAGWT